MKGQKIIVKLSKREQKELERAYKRRIKKYKEQREERFLKYMQENHFRNPLLRTLMTKVEIKMAESLVNKGLLVKGVSTEDARVKIYYADK